jgi:hypothetical protein
MTNQHTLFGWAGALALASTLAACGPDGAAGAAGPAGQDGKDGKAGTDGAQGATGATGAAGAPGATGANAPIPDGSIVVVTPDRVAAGRTTKVTVLGTGTRFTSATTVNFGAGITASNLRVLSEVSLEATLTVDPTATLGARPVSVTTGTTTLTQPNALRVEGSVEVNPVDPGTLAAGDEGALRVRITAPRVFAPSVSGTNFVVGNATLTAPAAVALGTSMKWLGESVGEITYAVNPFIATASPATFTLTYGEGGTETVNAPIAATTSTAVTAAATVSSSVPAGGGFRVFTFDAPANTAFAFTVTAASGATFAPRIRAYVQGTDAAIGTTSNGSFGARTGAAAATYAFVVRDTTTPAASAPIAITASVTAYGNEIEPNNDRATATPLVWNTPLVGTVGTTDRDFYSFTVGGTTPQLIEARVTNFGAGAARRVLFCDGVQTCLNTNESRTANSGVELNSGRTGGAWLPGYADPQTLTAQLPPGNWFVVVDPNSTTQAATDYAITIAQKTAVDETATNHTAAQALELPAGQVGRGSITVADALADWWKFNAAAGASYLIQTRPWIATDATNGALDSEVWICNENTALNTSTCSYETAPTGTFNDDTGPFSYGEFRFTPAAAGIHYVGVQRYGTSVGNYLLVVDKL